MAFKIFSGNEETMSFAIKLTNGGMCYQEGTRLSVFEGVLKVINDKVVIAAFPDGTWEYAWSMHNGVDLTQTKEWLEWKMAGSR
jgi:hypothetical protein